MLYPSELPGLVLYINDLRLKSLLFSMILVASIAHLTRLENNTLRAQS